MIIFFTGTGNGRYIAELIAKKLDDSIIASSQYFCRILKALEVLDNNMNIIYDRETDTPKITITLQGA